MFTYPVLLWFLPFLGVVILIHLINMFRHRRVEWAAMEFILASYKKSRSRILLQQFLLLLLRILAVAAVILMFAGPTLEGTFARWLDSFTGKGTHHIILLDDSFSMNERHLAQGGISVFEDAIPVVQKIAEHNTAQNHTAQIHAQDRLTLLKLSSPEPVFYELPLHADNLQTIQTTLSELKPSSFALDPAVMLASAVDFVRQTSSSHTAVYYLSDFRQKDWENAAPTLKNIETIKQLGGTIHMIRIAPPRQTNLGIDRITLVDGIHAADVDLLLDVTIAHFGQGMAKNINVSLFVDDQMRSQQTIPLLAANSKTEPPLRFPVRMGDSLPHKIDVRLQPDALPDDNQRFLSLQVPEALDVLLITPYQDTESLSSAQYIRTALAPGNAKSGIRIRQELPSYLLEGSLNAFHAIFILDIPTLDPFAVKALEDYVYDGGGVAFFPGTETNLPFVRNSLYKQGQGLFPADPIAVEELLPDFLTKTPDIRVLPHPIFRLFHDDDSPLLNNVIIERYWAVEPVTDSSVSVWATLRNDAPLVLEKTFGKGKTMSFLTSVAPSWNNWGRNPSYVVVLLELTAWLAKRSRPAETFLTGDSITVTINPSEFDERIQVDSPSQEEKPTSSNILTAEPQDDGSWGAVFYQTAASGFYTFRLKTRQSEERLELKAVNVDASEGDIRQAEVSEVSDLLRTIHVPLESAAGFSLSHHAEGNLLPSDWLLCAAILFLLGETFLAGRILPPNR